MKLEMIMQWQVGEGVVSLVVILMCRQGVVTSLPGPTSAPPEKLLGPMTRQHRGRQGIYTNRKKPERKTTAAHPFHFQMTY